MSVSTNTKKSGESNIQFLRRDGQYFLGSKWSGSSPDQEYEIVALQVGRGGVYGIVQVTNAARTTAQRFALVIKMETRSGATCYKVMSEAADPNLAHMSDKMYQKLTPVDDLPFDSDGKRYCVSWRARCKGLNDKKAALKPGVRFTVTVGVQFGHLEVFHFRVENPNTRMFIANPGTSDQFRCQLTHHCIDDMTITVLE